MAGSSRQASDAIVHTMNPAELDGHVGFYPDPPDNLPEHLDSLEDGPPGCKPGYPYSTLIRYAIKGSPERKLLLEEIYEAMENRFPYFKSAPAGWKNSVRHNLSLNPCFVKVARPVTDRGKGSYWTIDEAIDPRTGVHRVRKRSGKLKRDESGAQPPEAPTEPFCVELDEIGDFIWRNVWYNELIRLRQWTSDQERVGVGDDWYRVIFLRVRTALQHLVPPTDPVTGMPLQYVPPTGFAGSSVDQTEAADDSSES